MMPSLPSFDVVIGMVIVFLSVSLVCSSMNELLSSALALRASTLESALDSLLGPNLAQLVLDHPAIPAAPQGAPKAPSYIEPELFASVLLDRILPPHAAGDSTPPAPAAGTTPVPGAPSKQFTDAHAAITAPPADATLAGSPARSSLAALVRNAHGDYAKLHSQVAQWFDAYMDRVSGAYKRRAQWIIAVIAVLVVAILNVDSFKVYKQLTTQPAFASALANKASSILNASSPNPSATPSFGQAVDNVNKNIAALPVPIGWHKDDLPPLDPLWRKLVGLFITALAASLGAPFWFDALSKLANLRSVGAKPQGT